MNENRKNEELEGGGLPEARETARRLRDLGRAQEQGGALQEALRFYREALSILPSDHPDILQTDLLRWMGTIHRHLGEMTEAEDFYERSLASATEIEYLPGQAHAVNCLAIVAHTIGDLDEAVNRYRRAARLAAQIPDHRLSGMVEQNLGVLANVKGDLDGALVRYRASLRAFEEAEDEEGVSWVLNNLGMLETDLEEYGKAEKVLMRGLKIAQGRGDLQMEGLFQLNLAEMFNARGDWEGAALVCGEAYRIAEERGDPLRLAEALKQRAVIDRNQGRPTFASSSLEKALILAVEGEDKLLIAEIHREYGYLWESQGQTEKAEANWTESLQGFNELGALLDAAQVKEQLESLPFRRN